MLLELKNIKKHFPVKDGLFGKSQGVVKAVDDVDLTVRKGEHFGLVGESGCGKTTLGRIVVRLLAPDSGQIILENEDITRARGLKLRNARKNLQMVFQDPHSSLDPRFTILNILKEAMTFDKLKPSAKEAKAAEILISVGLKPDILSRFPHEFSGGERQRIAIARALIQNPKLLVLDEAVSSLDVIVQAQILELLESLKNKFDLTYFFISHNLKVIKRICPQVAVMYKGKILETGKTQEIFSNPVHAYTQELLSAAIHFKSLKRQDILFRENSLLIQKNDNHFVRE